MHSVDRPRPPPPGPRARIINPGRQLGVVGAHQTRMQHIACDILSAPADPRRALLCPPPLQKEGRLGSVRPAVQPPPPPRLHSPPRVPSLSSAVPQAPSICTRILSARLPRFHVTQAEMETPRFFMRLLVLASSLGRMGKCGMLSWTVAGEDLQVPAEGSRLRFIPQLQHHFFFLALD